ncbi:hypothetical protein NPIL_515471 [Nephila pilipes]|uniref:Uncharacterized protein n=1 Tax=Nephila pilipes TaxID=299642 RepID=A0A8X6R0I3_NEPPI|nr:hypothetical protein NPIL_515471 [Nephila pilipes]
MNGVSSPSLQTSRREKDQGGSQSHNKVECACVSVRKKALCITSSVHRSLDVYQDSVRQLDFSSFFYDACNEVFGAANRDVIHH